MGILIERARMRLGRWLDANPEIDQRALAASVGHGQSWISNFRSGKQQEATVDELAVMANKLGHSLFELLDVNGTEAERELLEAYRALPQERRQTALDALKLMVPAKPPRPRRTR